MRCPNPDLCEALGQHIHGGRWEIWLGEKLDAPTSHKFRRKWCGRAGITLEAARKIQPWTAPNLPPLPEQVSNLLEATKKHAANGFRTVSGEVQESRLAICRTNACGYFQGNRCGSCGCFLSVKTSWESEVCPESLWPR